MSLFSRGPLMMVIGMLWLGIGNALLKGISTEVSINQILFFRGLFGTLLLFLVGGYWGKKYFPFKTQQLGRQSLRGITGYFALYAIFMSFKLLPLSDATVLSFATVLFITILSLLFLGERFSWKVGAAILGGLGGIIIIAQPSCDVSIPGISFALVGALLESIVLFLGKLLGQKDSPQTCVFYHTLWSFVIAGLVMIGHWQLPPWTDLAWILGLAVSGLLGQVFIVRAYQLAPAVRVSPMLYTLIIWGVLFGTLFWGEILDLSFILGSSIVIITGVYIVHAPIRSARRKNAGCKKTDGGEG